MRIKGKLNNSRVSITWFGLRNRFAVYENKIYVIVISSEEKKPKCYFE